MVVAKVGDKLLFVYLRQGLMPRNIAPVEWSDALCDWGLPVWGLHFRALGNRAWAGMLGV